MSRDRQSNDLRKQAPSRATKFGRGVRAKLMLLTLSVAVIPIAAVGYMLINVNSETLEQTNQELLSAIVDDIAASVDRSLLDVETVLGNVSGALVSPTVEEEHRLTLATRAVEASETVGAVALFDLSGERIDSIQEEGALVDFPALLPQDFLALAQKSPPAIGNVVILGDTPVALVAMPVRGEATTWIATAYVSLEIVQRRVERITSARFGETNSSIFVVDDQLRALAHSDPEHSLALASMKESPTLTGVSGTSFKSGIAFFGDFERAGQHVVGAAQSLGRLPWAVVVEVPASDAYASIDEMRSIVLTIIAIAIALSVLIAIWFATKITSPIRSLVHYTDSLAEHDFTARVHIKSSDELAILGNALNNAAMKLAAGEQLAREEMAIRADLGRYLPSQLVEKIVSRDQEVSLGGERREVTVMFADVAAFTPMAESQDAEDVVTILNELFTVLTEVVFRHRGTVDKFIGDCVMAFWGAPTQIEDHACLAVTAAEDMLRWIEVANEHWAEKYGITIYLAIGIHTGDCIVGNFGSESRMEYTAVGDTINVAARLESIARPQQILVSSATREAAGPNFSYIDLGSHKLAGRVESVEIHELRA